MAIISPQTNIKLLKVPLCIDNTNQLTFSNATAQYNYFNSLPKLEYDNCTFQRKDNYMAINVDMDSLLEYNYVMYQNSQYGDDKWFYAYITKMEYQNNKCTYVYIKTDVYQTWQFDITFKRSFVEREHTNNDTIGANTIPENVELGEYINCEAPMQSATGTSSYIVAGVSEIVWLPSGSIDEHSYYNGVIGGLIYIILKDTNAFDMMVYTYNQAGKIEAIQTVFMIPTEFEPNPTWLTIPNTQGEYAVVSQKTGAYVLDIINVNVPTTMGDNYTPTNKKLMTYPYRYLMASNNTGTDIVYKYEDFDYFNQSPVGIVSFGVTGAISPSCSIKIAPRDYKGVTGNNYAEGFNMGKYPIGSWINDIYVNWLRQNGLNVGLNIGASALHTLGGLAMLTNPATAISGASSVASGLLSISQSLAEVRRESMTPPQAEGNINTSDVMFALKKLAPTFYHMSIKNEYLRVIDNFFSMYGYKTNRVKIPNRTGRYNWNYVKTIGCNITGNIPQDDLKEIKDMFDKGITLWHRTTTFLDYSQANPIV